MSDALATAAERSERPDPWPQHGSVMAHRWYIVHAYSNFEKKVADAIRTEAERTGLTDCFEEILVPTEQVIEVRRGRKVETERKNFPGYVLVKMDMTDAAYHLVKDTKSVVGFLGDSGKPQPVPQREIDRIMDTAEESGERPRPTITYEIGEKVKVTDGPFESFLGEVQDVDHENARLKVSVSIFGRETPVELEYAQVAKQG